MAGAGMAVVVMSAGTMVIVAMVMMVFVFTATSVVAMFVFVFMFVTFTGHFLILLHMGNSGAENSTDMGVIEGIIHLFSLSAVFYEPCGFKNGKLV